MLEEQKKWFVITTKSRAEKKVALEFEKYGIGYYLPIQKQLRQWKDRKKWVEVPLFNSYVFVQIAEEQKNIVFEVQGVIKFLAIKGKLSVLPDEEIERIKKICNYDHEVSITSENIFTLNEVEVIEGPLKGLKGRISDKGNNTYLYIQIENLGFAASFKIDKKWVKILL